MNSSTKELELDDMPFKNKRSNKVSHMPSHFKLRDSKIEQNNFEIENGSIDSSEDNDQHKEFA